MKRRDAILIFIKGVGLISVANFASYSCKWLKSPTEPDNPIEPPEEVEYYDYEVTYKRPNGSIVGLIDWDPDEAYFYGEYPAHQHPSYSRKAKLTKQSEYVFTGTLLRVGSGSRCEIYVVDPKRWQKMTDSNPRYGSPHSVGDIFILRCKQTGFEKQLTKIVDNPHISPPSGYTAKMAQFEVQSDGSIID